MPHQHPTRSHRTRTRVRLPLPRPARGDDGGFTLLEVMVSIAIITIVMAALTSLYARSISTSSLLRAKQSAAALATSALDTARSIGAVDAVLGRTQTAVDAQFAAFAGTPVAPWLASMDRAYGDGAYAADLPTTAVRQVMGGAAFDVNYFVGTCHRQYSYTSNPLDCTNGAKQHSLSYIDFVRVVVAVTWSDASCTGGTCYRVSAVLVNGDDDPLFNLNEQNPPPPDLHDCLDQSVMIGVPVDIAIFGKAQPNESAPICTLDGGVPTFTWSATALPDGLTLDPDGHIRGKPTGVAGAVTTRITVTDVYGVQPSTGNEFGWTVKDPAPTIETPLDQRSRVGAQFALSLSYTCPAGGCTFTLAGPQDVEVLAPEPTPPADGDPTEPPADPTEPPPGPDWTISVDPDGVIRGIASATPTILHGLTATVTAPNGKSATTGTFDWTFTDGPTLPVIGDRTSGAGETVSLPIAGDCGSHPSCQYTASGAPPGVSIDAASGVMSGAATVPGQYTVTVTLTDSQSPADSATARFTWAVSDGTTIDPIPDQTWTPGQQIDPIAVSVICGWAPCSFPQGAATGLPASVGFDRPSGVISGSPSATGSGTATITVADAGGNTVSVSFGWVSANRLGIAAIDNQSWRQGTAIGTLAIGATCDSAPCTVTGAGLPAGVIVKNMTIIGTPTAQGSGAATITVKNSKNATATATFAWRVYKLPTVNPISSITWAAGDAIGQIGVTGSCDWAPCVFTATGLPAGISISPAGTISGTPATAKTGTATVVSTDGGGASASATLSWTVLTKPTIGNIGAHDGWTKDIAITDIPLVVTCGQAPCTITATGLPKDVTVDAATMKITGTPSKKGSDTATITVTNKNGVGKASTKFHWTVA